MRPGGRLRLAGAPIRFCPVSARQRFRDSAAFNYMARYMLSDLSFDTYLEVGGWRGYARKAAKDAFVTEARSWLEPLEKNARLGTGAAADTRECDGR